MRRALLGLPLLGLCALASCTPGQVSTALQSPPGQLFCSFQLAGGGTLVAGLVDAAATAANPGLGQVAVIATGAGANKVNNDCAEAAKNVAGATGGVPVSPPANPASAAQVAVVPPKS